MFQPQGGMTAQPKAPRYERPTPNSWVSLGDQGFSLNLRKRLCVHMCVCMPGWVCTFGGAHGEGRGVRDNLWSTTRQDHTQPPNHPPTPVILACIL